MTDYGVAALTVQLCTVDDLIGGDPCTRVARWKWQPDGPGTHPVFLCNFHAEPLTADGGWVSGSCTWQ